MSVDSVLPKINLPTVSSLLGRPGPVQSEEDRIIEKAARMQIEEEAETENTLLKILDYLGRPQAAVAGVLTDLIDGGDFSPLDRVSHAFMGNERYRMKDFIDVIAPGDWDKTRLPEWMGGHEVDLFKESVGFVGDVFTDPMMMVSTFASVKNIAKAGDKLRPVGFHGKKIAGRVQPFHEIYPSMRKALSDLDTPELKKRLLDSSNKKARSIGIAMHSARASVGQHYRLAEAKIIFDDIIRDPDKFKAMFQMNKGGSKFWDSIQPHLGKDMHVVDPSLATRLREGEATLFAVRMPALMRAAGIPDGQFSLVPKFADEWASYLVKGVEEMTGHLMNTPFGDKTRKFLRNIFTAGTGSREGDLVVSAVSKVQWARGVINEKYAREVKDMFKGKDKKFRDKVLDLIRRPFMFFYEKQGAWLEARHIPKDMLEPVKKIKRMLGDQKRQIDATPGMKVGFIGVKNMKPKKAYELITSNMKRQGFEVGDLMDWKNIERTARKYQKRLKGDLKIGEVEEKILKQNLRSAQWDMQGMIPMQELGYMPRKLSMAGKQIYADLMQAGKLLYKGKPATEALEAANLSTRKMVELSVPEFNRLAREGGLPYDFMEKVMESARTSLKGKDRNMFQKLLGEMEADEISMFVDDPVQLVTQYMVESSQALNLQEKLNHLTQMFAMRIDDVDNVAGLGERRVILSPEGMKARYGKDWRKQMDEVSLAAYDQAQKELATKGNEKLGNLFLAVDEDVVESLTKTAAGIPVHAIPGDIADAMNRFVHASQNGAHQGPIMNAAVKITNIWKQITLAPFPGYHFRNWANGFWQAFLGDSLNPKHYEAAIKIMRNSGNGFKVLPTKNNLRAPGGVSEMVITNKGFDGKKIGGIDAYHYAQQEGIFETGYMNAEMLHMTKGEFAAEARTYAQKAKLTFDKATEKLFAFGNDFENVHRFSHFINRLAKGDTPASAAMSVKKNFYNFNELSHFEKKYLRLVFPFYSWSRKNIPRQFEGLLREPGKYAQAGRLVHLLESDEAADMDPNLLPAWVKKNVGVPIRVNPETGNYDVKMWGNWMGWTDLRNWVSQAPHMAVADTAADLLNPLAKVPLELMTNYNFYSEKPIRRYPGEPYGMPYLGMDLDRTTVHALRGIRLLNEPNKLMYGKSVSGEVPLSQRIRNLVSATPKTLSFDLEDLKATREFEVLKRKGEIKRTVRRTKAVDAPAAARIIEKHKKEVRKIGAGKS
jgi:hypothetical protein